MAKKIYTQDQPNLTGQPVVEFRQNDFDAMIWNKGYECLIEKAVKCPCRTKDNDSLSTCKSCLGTGWVYLDGIEDRFLLNSINFDQKYKDWSAEKIGTVNVTSRSLTQLAFMDRITVKDSLAMHSEILFPRDNTAGIVFSYTIYPIEEIEEIYRFSAPERPLILLKPEIDYTFKGNKVNFTSNFGTVSIRYKHHLQYYVLDIPHIVRNSYKKNDLGQDEMQIMPVNAVARLAHYIFDSIPFTGSFDASFDVSFDRSGGEE